MSMVKGLAYLILDPVYLIMLWCYVSYFTMTDMKSD